MDPNDLCEACSAVFTDGSVDRYGLGDIDVGNHEDEDDDGDGDSKDNRKTAMWHAHHLTAAAHRQAIAQGCIPCSWIPTTDGEERGTFFCFAAAGRWDDSDNYCVLLGRPRCSSFRNGSDLVKRAVTIFAIPVDAFDDHARLIHLGELSLSSGNTGSKEVVQMANGWLQHCLKSHELCTDTSGATWWPRRLLALDGTVAKLVETTGQDLAAPYATLSHCWGGMPTFVLTSQNMGDLEKGLAFSQFDATFHDAMITAQNLGINYIWIDCYCIIQGQDEASLQDWREQSILMHKVYSNGILNISAAHGVDSRAGLFVPRERRRDLCTIRWQPSFNTSESPYSWSVVQLNSRSLDFQVRARDPQELESLPLFSRGWVLQERLLARRMLSFGATQVFWDCACIHQASETLPRGQNHLDRSLAPGRLTNPNPEARTRVYEEVYRDAVHTYSLCKLSFPHKDKLAAFEGVGRRICELLGTEYLNGFPRSTLPFSLCWNGSKHGLVSGWGRIAPSWHWASCETVWWTMGPERRTFGAKHFSHITLIDGHGPLVDRSLEYADLVCIGRPLRISEIYHFPGRFRSRLRVAKSPYDIYRDSTTRISFLDDHQDIEHVQTVTPSFDDIDEFKKKSVPLQVYLLPIWNPSFHGLVLSRSSDGSFRREGIFGEWADHADQEIRTAMLNTKAQLVVIR